MHNFKRRSYLNDYEERKQARIDHYREKAEQARQESRQLYQQSSICCPASRWASLFL